MAVWRGAAWAWRGQYLFRRVGVSSSVAAQRKDMAIMNSIKQLRRIYTIPSCPLSLHSSWTAKGHGHRLLLHSCGGNVSSPLLFYDFYIELLLYSRKWKVRKKGDTRGGRRTPPFRVGPGRAGGLRLAVPPSLHPSGVRSVFTIRPRGTPKDDIISAQESRFGKKKEKEGRGATMAVTAACSACLPCLQSVARPHSWRMLTSQRG